jgi:hypothetical protein
MRVLVAPSLLANDLVAGWVRSLAGRDGEVVSLGPLEQVLSRRQLSAAEVQTVRSVLLDSEPGGSKDAGEPAGVVGYVCTGTSTRAAGQCRVIAVTDHANLGWRSPLMGPNDDLVGPRFPVVAGVYAPEVVATRINTTGGGVVTRGVVAGVLNDREPRPFESRMARQLGMGGFSSQLVPVVLLAAHLGLRVAAAVVVVK